MLNEVMLTANEIGTHFNLNGEIVNRALVEIGFMNPAETGGYLIKNHKYGVQCFTKKGKIPFIRWNKIILKNQQFKSTLFQMSKIINRHKFKAEFRTEDGHYVRSKAEVIIDNYLYHNGIIHSYERRLPIEEDVYTDFFIPVYNIYIEYWGYENDLKYLNRKVKKQQIYKEHGLNLIELQKEDIKNIDDVLPLNLLKYGLLIN